MGDINGVGPEILAKALARPEIRGMCDLAVIGCPRAFEAARRWAPGCPPARAIGTVEEAADILDGQEIPVIVCGPPAPAQRWGALDPAAGASAAAWVAEGVRLAQSGAASGLVTCPLSKECLHLAGSPYIGHTDMIAAMTGAPEYRMSLFAGPLRAVHVTAHLPLSEAIAALTVPRVTETVRIAAAGLRRLGIAAPRIAVAGLNPHAGEAGLLGREEIEVIAPAVAACRAAGIDCSGPHPPDTVFVRMREGEFDAVTALYHDQGHIPLKLIAMDEGVNVTLGIPIVRTSPDHGTAYDIAGTGAAREDSLCAAISLAARLACASPEPVA